MASASWNSFDAAVATSSEKDFSEDVSVIRENLDRFASEDTVLGRRRALQISELASLLSLPEYASFRDDLSDFTATVFRAGDDPRANKDVATFCLELIRRGYPIIREGRLDDLFGNGEPPSQKAVGRVAYLRSRATDEAFRILSGQIDQPRAAYFTSFSDICEEVYHGLCEYCILPIENHKSGKLHSFYTLIEKYELYIVSVADLDDSDGYTRYALLRSRYAAPSPAEIHERECYAEFSLVLTDGISLPDVLSAAELLGLRVTRVDSLPYSERTHEYRYGLVFLLPRDSGSSRAVEAFLLYLSLTLPEYTPLGIYTKF